MRIELDRDEAERFERRRLYDGHVIGRFDGRTRDVRAGARSYVRHAPHYFLTDWKEQVEIVERLQ